LQILMCSLVKKFYHIIANSYILKALMEIKRQNAINEVIKDELEDKNKIIGALNSR
jgi:hypothetical protein